MIRSTLLKLKLKKAARKFNSQIPYSYKSMLNNKFFSPNKHFVFAIKNVLL